MRLLFYLATVAVSLAPQVFGIEATINGTIRTAGPRLQLQFPELKMIYSGTSSDGFLPRMDGEVTAMVEDALAIQDELSATFILYPSASGSEMTISHSGKNLMTITIDTPIRAPCSGLGEFQQKNKF
ncbi:hypothetical protein DM01DRAFT_1333585 [Hesseltinella vesiculosa]|uniref:Uncharacterized protein n=1 Tax=Hesseltinella vesiculosa TaxID=101127 RepID=A0A1X2GQK1_9FUNG|nr:hypothetical protein DM01DRAFT_1333585 [Hesseltinella vesiculosa]